MKVYCAQCDTRYDDEFRTTICPHETFAANDGKNNFAHHPESFIEPKRCPQCGAKVQNLCGLLVCPGCDYYTPEACWGI